MNLAPWTALLGEVSPEEFGDGRMLITSTPSKTVISLSDKAHVGFI